MQHIGTYRLERQIGNGGMGRVFGARHVDDGSPAAVKVIQRNQLDRERQRRFEREGDALAAFDHPNIVRFLDRGVDDGVHWLAMELVEGETLSTAIRGRPLPLAEALDVLRDVARALAAVHAAGFVHRDVKSSNVIRSANGRAVLIDFGLTCRSQAPTLSRDNGFVGTVPYMSPERLMGIQGDARADVWSAGLLLYEMLTGALPWRVSRSSHAIAKQILCTSTAKMSTPAVTDSRIARLLADMLSFLPRERLRDGQALARRLSEIETPRRDSEATSCMRRRVAQRPAPTTVAMHRTLSTMAMSTAALERPLCSGLSRPVAGARMSGRESRSRIRGFPRSLRGLPDVPVKRPFVG